MIWHPIVLSILVCDSFVFFLLLFSMKPLFQVILHWSPEDSSQRQLALEPRFEVATIQNILAFFLFSCSTILIFFAISSVLPATIPGAMCGTGAMEAMGAHGIRALITRFMVLTLFYIFYQLFLIARSTPRGRFQTQIAKILILVFPILLLSIYETIQAFWGINMATPVDCCAAIYDTIRAPSGGSVFNIYTLPAWLTRWGSPFFSVCLILTAVLSKRRQWLLIPISLFWIMASYVLLINHLLPYHYGVLSHSCPWCIFGVEHSFQGFPILFCMLAVTWACIKIVLSRYAANRYSKPTTLIFSIFLFYAFSSWPSVIWYISRGTWIQS